MMRIRESHFEKGGEGSVVIEASGHVVTIQVEDNNGLRSFSCLVHVEGKEDERPVGGYVVDV